MQGVYKDIETDQSAYFYYFPSSGDDPPQFNHILAEGSIQSIPVQRHSRVNAPPPGALLVP